MRGVSSQSFNALVAHRNDVGRTFGEITELQQTEGAMTNGVKVRIALEQYEVYICQNFKNHSHNCYASTCVVLAFQRLNDLC